MPTLLFDVSHTCHTRARTGVQRVVRSLLRELGDGAQAVTHDPYQGAWRPVEAWERANLEAETPGAKRGARWPWSARLRGRWRRWTGAAGARPADAAGFLTAEIFSPAVGAQLPSVFPRVAVFHDAIALRHPELSPAGTVARFPAYLAELLRFDGVAAVSEDSRAALADYWRWAGAVSPPPVVAIPLGVDPVRRAVPGVPPAEPVVLSVGTLEGRKNHLALLEACERLWAGGARFTLRLAGGVQAETGRQAHARLQALQAAGRPIRFDGALTDAALAAAYAECAFTVYPSIAEGFGLPVIESLAHGRPCLCSGRGALGELSRQGGCVALESVDPATLAAAIGGLLAAPEEQARLAAAARARNFRTWADYTRDLLAWTATLPRRSARA
ncbi:MAG: glycosyltransferase [Verrucomicrobia bacterium]|nr:glycosyltransferase [Verrucomicrobiota bacterium]